MKTKYEKYVNTLQKLADIEHSIAVLSWDKEVNLPENAAAMRGQQVATLSGIAHEIFTEDSFGELLNELNAFGNELSFKQKRNIQTSLKDYKKFKKFSNDFVIRRSKVTSSTYHAWLKARKENDFALFKDALREMVDVKRKEAEILGYEDHPYDALIDEFEPELKTEHLTVLFKDVREQLVEFVKELKGHAQVDDSFLYKFYPKQKQWDFGINILKAMAYDFNAGRQDLSPHPFTTSFGATDVRVTTRIDEHNFGNMTWSCIHEGGHALYEQGLPIEDYGLPSGKYVSLGIHESQSRLWENNVGRSLGFWKTHYTALQQLFPGNLKKVSLNDFYKGINKVVPSLIRTESDELHYHFHILIRFEIEKGLIEGSLEVEDLDKIWNEKYLSYLGVEVPDDNNGVLQDIHWAHGSFGYFATYSLGSFYAAQFFKQALKDIPNLSEQIEKGDTSKLLEWLRENIHQHGMTYNADELCEKVTGEKLNFKYFMDYAREKYNAIYAL